MYIDSDASFYLFLVDSDGGFKIIMRRKKRREMLFFRRNGSGLLTLKVQRLG